MSWKTISSHGLHGFAFWSEQEEAGVEAAELENDEEVRELMAV